MKKARSVFLGIVAAWILWAFVIPAGGGDSKVVSIGVGQGASSISHTLSKAGLVHSALAFRVAARITGDQSELKAGDYEVPGGLNVFQTLSLLVGGKALVHPFLVREGLNVKQLAALIEKEGLGRAEAFLQATRDPEILRELAQRQLPGDSAEGYLFPDTYNFPKGMDEKALVKLMVARFNQKVPPALLAQGAAIHLSPQQVVTMASLVQMEARVPEDAPLISAVYRNRMRRKMRLEADPTVRYALDKYSGPVFYKDLDSPSPYNTYRHYGLPPGPICSPGAAAIVAALNPAPSDALFFVVGAGGRHTFSVNYEDHLKAVAQYKKLKRAQKGSKGQP